MKQLLLILILTLSFQSWAKTDDIKDFEIEGMSIGNSLLDYFTKNVIENEKFFEKEQGNNKEVARFYIREKKGNYDWLAMSFKTSDNNYSLIELSGFIFVPFAECKEKRDKIDNEIKKLFINSQRQVTGDIEHFLDKNSFTNNIAYWTSETKNDYISLTCYDWSEQSGYKDQLRIEVYSDEYYSWLSKLQKS